MNANDYGITFQFGTGFDMSSSTSLQIAFVKPDKSTLTVSAGVGSADSGSFLAHQYATYTFASGDINQAGTYTARVIYTDSSKSLHSDVGSFSVGP